MNKIIYSICIGLLLFQNAAFAGFPVTVKDDTGYRFTALAEPKRIISTIPSNTEILFALGLGSRIVGVSDKCNYPPIADKIKKCGGVELNAEQIISMNPDLIVMLNDAQKKEVDRLRGLDLPVFVINPHTIGEMLKDIKLLGKITGTERTAELLTDDIKEEIKNITVRHRAAETRPKILVVIWDSPLTTAGKGTFIDDMIRIVGGVNLGASAKGAYPVLSFESVLKADPDFIIVSGKSTQEVNRITDSDKWNELRAVQDDKILLIDSDLITRPTPRAIQALDIISAFIR